MTVLTEVLTLQQGEHHVVVQFQRMIGDNLVHTSNVKAWCQSDMRANAMQMLKKEQG